MKIYIKNSSRKWIIQSMHGFFFFNFRMHTTYLPTKSNCIPCQGGGRGEYPTPPLQDPISRGYVLTPSQTYPPPDIPTSFDTQAPQKGPGTRDIAPQKEYGTKDTHQPPLPVDKMTHTCENVTFLQLRWRPVNIDCRFAECFRTDRFLSRIDWNQLRD